MIDDDDDGGCRGLPWGGLRGLGKNNSFHDASEGSSVNGRARKRYPRPLQAAAVKCLGFPDRTEGKGMENPGLGRSRPRTVGKSLLTLTLG